MLRPEPVPSSPSSAISTPGGGGARRCARRRSRSRPGASPRRPARMRCAGPARATSASASNRIRRSTARRSTLTASSSVAICPRALLILGQQQLEAGVGAVQPPGGVDPRRERGTRARRCPARWDPRARPPSARAAPAWPCRPARAARAHEPAVLAAQRHHVGDRRERHEIEVARLPWSAPKRLRELVGDAGRAQVRARIAAHRRMHDRAVRQRAVGARRVVVGDDDVEAQPPARSCHLLDGGDRAVDGDQQLASRAAEPRERSPPTARSRRRCRSGRYQSTSAPSARSARTRIAVEHTPSTS